MNNIEDLGICSTHPTTGKLLKNKTRFFRLPCPSCQKTWIVNAGNYKRGKTKQCKDCYTVINTQRIIKQSTKHGSASRNGRTKLYQRWLSMCNRCNNPKDTHWRYYGGKGIKVCDAWKDFPTFKLWAESNGYSPELSIDRIDVDGDYCPDNCRYVVATTQAANVNKRISNTSGYKGVTANGKNWQAQISVKNKHIYLGTFNTPEDAAKAYDQYVLSNQLPHRINKV